MRRFNIKMTSNYSDIMGTGIVGEGCLFKNGKVCIHWYGKNNHMSFWDSIDEEKWGREDKQICCIEWID